MRMKRMKAPQMKSRNAPPLTQSRVGFKATEGFCGGGSGASMG
jgi:hypothetical protein